MEYRALSEVHVGREMFRTFDDWFALERDHSEWTLPEHRPRGWGAGPGDPLQLLDYWEMRVS